MSSLPDFFASSFFAFVGSASTSYGIPERRHHLAIDALIPVIADLEELPVPLAEADARAQRVGARRHRAEFDDADIAALPPSGRSEAAGEVQDIPDRVVQCAAHASRDRFVVLEIVRAPPAFRHDGEEGPRRIRGAVS